MDRRKDGWTQGCGKKNTERYEIGVQAAGIHVHSKQRHAPPSILACSSKMRARNVIQSWPRIASASAW